MGLIVTPWTQQPKASALVDYGNPASRGLVGLLESVTKKDLVTGASYNSAGRTPSRSGIGHGSTSGTSTSNGLYSNRIGTDPNTNWRPTSPVMTAVCVFDYYAHGSSSIILSVGAGTGGDGFSLYSHFSDGTPVVFLKSGATTGVVYGSTGQLVVGSSNVIALTYDGSVLRGYLNGRQFGSSTVALGNMTAYNATYTRTCLVGSPDVSGSVSLAQYGALFNRSLSPVEIYELSRNPWKIFKPIPRRIFVGVAQSSGLGTVYSDYAASYGVRGLVSSDQSASYAIRSSAQADRSAAYNVRTSAFKDATAAYSIRNAINADRSASYVIRSNAQQDLASVFNVRSTVQADRSAIYDIQSASSVASNLSASYSVRAAVQSDRSASYAVRSSVQADRSASYAVRSSVQKDAVASYSIAASVASVSADLSASYSIDGVIANYPSAADIAAAVLALAQVTPIHSDLRKVNGDTITGHGIPPTYDNTGTMTDPGNPWRPQ